jgi:NDP-sugar pyrophosphorylase family protein
MTLQCVILAGGLGTRMRPVTESVPKALLPVSGRPFVDWQLRLLAARGVRRVVLSIGYRGDMVRDHVGDGSRFGVDVSWVDEGAELRGTGGALRLALDGRALEDEFFVLYGDSYLPVPLGDVEEAWRGSGMPALMTVMRNEGRWDASNVVYRDGRVLLYDKAASPEEQAQMRWIDYGLSVLTREVVGERFRAGEVADLADLMRDLSRAGRLAGFEATERFYEIGSPAGLQDLESYLAGESWGPTQTDQPSGRPSPPIGKPRGGPGPGDHSGLLLELSKESEKWRRE